MTTAYDPELLQKYADALYRRAATLAVSYFVRGCLLGYAAALLALFLASKQQGAPDFYWPIVPALLIGVAFGIHGRHKAWMLRLEAQRGLCQSQIEENTRALLTRKTDVLQAEPKQFAATAGR